MSFHIHLGSSVTLFLLLFSISFSGPAYAAGNETDRLALLKIRESISGDPQGLFGSWNDSVHFCGWRGVTCGIRRQRVTSLIFESLGLRGTISPFVGNLSFLRSLNLRNNSLSGEITPEIGRLFRLQHLTFTNNSLEGEIPANLSRCSQLKTLYLRNNKLTGSCPAELGSLANLEVLSVPENRLTGEIPPSFGNISSLNVLELSANNLKGGIPAELGRLKHLMFFVIGLNNLSGTIPPSIYNISSIQSFVVSVNRLRGNFPSTIGLTLPNLRNFLCATNEFSGRIPESLSNASQLPMISLSKNNLVGHIPANLGNLQNLFRLSLFSNRLGDNSAKSWDFLPSLTNCNALRRLSLSMNDFGGVLPESITNLSTGLEELYLGNNGISGKVPSSLERLVNLTIFTVEGNLFTGFIPASIGKLPNLQVLSMARNRLSGEIPSSLGSLSKIYLIDLSGNELEGEIPRVIVNCKRLQQVDLFYFITNSPDNCDGQLREFMVINKRFGPLVRLTSQFSFSYTISERENDLELGRPKRCELTEVRSRLTMAGVLHLSHNRISGNISGEIFGRLSSLIRLNVSRNRLSGSIPVEVRNLKNLISLDLSENNLTSEIPETIRGCKSIERIDLHKNSIRGALPSALSSLRNLQYLDLSLNNLTGNISKGLEKLRFLLYLNLSFNNLEGEVPSEGVFQNTSAVSLTGNSNLRGGEPEFKLPKCKNGETKREMAISLKLTIVIVSVGFFLLLSCFVVLYWRRRSTKLVSLTDSTIGLLSKVSYSVLHKATDAFSPNILIGTGSFSSVYKGVLDQEDNPIAVKVLNLQNRGAEKSFIAECNALRTIRHRNLVKVLTCCSSSDHNGNDFKAIVFEYMPNGSLEKWLHPGVDGREKRSPYLSLTQRVDIAIDVASAIHYLHSDCDPQIIHRDLKPSNILLDREMVAHVSDFGLARLISNAAGLSGAQSSTIGIKGTIGFVAPEYVTGSEPSKQGDVYSYGILLLEMFTGKRPTEKIFKDDRNLHNFVKMALPERLVEIVDATLLSRKDAGNEYRNYSTNGEEHGSVDVKRPGEISARLVECLVSALEIGVACSRKSPNERMEIGEVIRELRRVRKLIT